MLWDKIVIASNNAGKLKELQALFSPLKIELIPQSDLGITEIEETGKTFIENSIAKARHAAQSAKLPALADDSGLVVAALDGAPGIYSARYAGVQQNSKQNIEKLLHNLKDIPQEQRQAYFYCVIILMQHAEDPTPFVCEGKWEGQILQQPQGQGGFGYDPIFYVPELKKSAAELPLELKNGISHRGKALKELLKQLCKH